MTRSERPKVEPLPLVDQRHVVDGLVAILRRLAMARSIPEIMDVVLHAARVLLGADGVTFVLREGDVCHYADEDAIAPLWKGRRFPMSACVSGWSMLHDQAVAIADVDADPRVPQDAYRPTFVRSLAMAPVREREPVAAIGAYWAQPRTIAAEELELLQTIANASGLAISVARLEPLAQARRAAEAAEARYRAIFDQAAVGVARVSVEGRFLEVNERFCRIAGRPSADLLALDFAAITHPEDLAADLAQLADLQAGAIETYAMEKRYLRPDGEAVWINLTVSAVRRADGAADYFVAVIEDISARKAATAAEQARAAEFHALADNVPVLCWMAYADGHIYWYNRRWLEYTGASLESQAGWGWETVHHPDYLPAVVARWRRSLDTGEPFEMVFPMRRADGVFRPFLTRIVPVRDGEGRIVRWFGSNTDVAEQEAHQEHLQLLVNELNHRVKNTLVTVQSMAAQTLRTADDPQLAYQQLEARLMSLSAAHNILTETNWEGARLREVIARTVKLFSVEAPGRFTITGPEVWLQPQAAVALSLAFHELATNAVKYGALAAPDGVIEVSWTLEEVGRRLELTWRERGGPPVAPRTRKGFGSRLIETSLARELGAPARMEFAPDGLICRIEARLPAGQPAAPSGP